MKKQTLITSMLLGLLFVGAIVVAKTTIGIIDIRTNFTGTVSFLEEIDLGERYIGEEIKVADVWVHNATVPLYMTLMNGTNVDEEHIVFWVESPVKKLVLPLEFNKTTNITSSESGNYTIWQRGNIVGPVHAWIKIECDYCDIE